MNEGAIRPARYDKGTLDTNHNAATGERGYGNNLNQSIDQSESKGLYIRVLLRVLGYRPKQSDLAPGFSRVYLACMVLGT